MKAKLTLGIAILIIGLSLHSFAQMTAYANIYCEVVAPIGIEKSADLTFNEIVSSKNTSTVILGVNNSLITSGVEIAQTGKGTLATFAVTGGNQTTFDVTLPKETFTINNGGASNMLVSNFTSTSSPTNALIASASIIKIGATLNVPENQAAGNFSAQDPFLVTLNYN